MTAPTANTRVFIDWKQWVPGNSVLEFDNATSVADYFGSSSDQAAEANEYFGTAPASMLFTRDNRGERPHLIGANLSGYTLATLQSISGPFSITFNNFTYTGQVNLSSVTNLTDIATSLTHTLLQNIPVQAHTKGGSIIAHTTNFTGYVNIAQVYTTDGTQLKIGSKIHGPGIIQYNSANTQIILATGPGHWATAAGAGYFLTPEAMTATYSIWRPGTVTGKIQVGDRLTGKGVPPLTAIVSDLGDGSYLINNTINVLSGFNATVTAPPLIVDANTMVGPDKGPLGFSNAYLSIQPDIGYGFNNNPSTLSFATGTTANFLGLSQFFGAKDSTPGGVQETLAQMMNNIVKEVTAQTGGSFGSFQDNIQRDDQGLALWQQKHPEYLDLSAYGYHSSTPPAGWAPPSHHFTEAYALLSAPLSGSASISHQISVHGGLDLAAKP